MAGWLDDCYKLSAKLRLLIHFVASALAAYLLIPAGTSIFFIFFAILWVSWAVNFFNFMDGIDGLAASEAVLVGIGGACISMKFGLNTPVAISLLISSGSLGFLFWNWPPAKIFMGDAGSGFLGYVFGCLSIASGWGFKGSFGTWLILLGLFFFDSTFTLLRRINKNEKFWEPHKSHLYQRALLSGFSHKQIVCVFVFGNFLLFSPRSFHFPSYGLSSRFFSS